MVLALLSPAPLAAQIEPENRSLRSALGSDFTDFTLSLLKIAKLKTALINLACQLRISNFNSSTL